MYESWTLEELKRLKKVIEMDYSAAVKHPTIRLIDILREIKKREGGSLCESTD